MLTKLQLGLGRFLAEIEGNALDNDDNILRTIYDLIFTGTGRALVLTAVGLFAVIKGVTLGMGIVQAADDQQARKEKINSLKYMIIGVVLVVALYLGAGALIDMIVGMATKK